MLTLSCSFTCVLSWLIGCIISVIIIFKVFRKRIFAAFCSNMAKGRIFHPEKSKSFDRLNDQARTIVFFSPFLNSVSFYSCPTVISILKFLIYYRFFLTNNDTMWLYDLSRLHVSRKINFIQLSSYNVNQ